MLLKHLSSITDEDAIEVAKICRFVGVRLTQEQIGRMIVFGNSIYKPEFEIAIEIIDYLRSKSYAYLWMGLSVEEMVEAGWIKLTD